MERQGQEGEDGEGDEAEADEYLESRLARYDRWVREGKIPYSSRVVPIQQSIEAVQWVLPTEQVVNLLRGASSVALADCICRTHYQRCNTPVEVCLRLDEAADSCVASGKGCFISLDEANEVLRKADERGLVHMAVYNPGQQVYAVCSCCSCCCHEFQYLRKYGRKDLVARSDYVARTDMDACTGCRECVDRCPFQARIEVGDKTREDGEACYGCGLCVTTCPSEAVTLEPRVRDSK